MSFWLHVAAALVAIRVAVAPATLTIVGLVCAELVLALYGVAFVVRLYLWLKPGKRGNEIWLALGCRR